MSKLHKPFFSRRLVDYLLIVGTEETTYDVFGTANTIHHPQLLRRFPPQDYPDFYLPPDVVYFCQPEGYTSSIGNQQLGNKEATSFIFTLTEKDSGMRRYGVSVNFYQTFNQPLQLPHDNHPSQANDNDSSSPRQPQRQNKTFLISLCIISHHAFFTSFRKCINILREIIDTHPVCHQDGNSSQLWLPLIQASPNQGSQYDQVVEEIEAWIERFLKSPTPIPGQTRVEIELLDKHHSPIVLALPNSSRFTLTDFPVHLPVELLGVETFIRVFTCMLLQHKYNR
ncbi:uncharacterized protein TRIADDRAFT_51824 [Trichoplax adhaerens]|uniref:UDENN domain-containing protein n=1 Tax=Trichoplax adhaerens TaxID=10228 RepID=B3RKZ7_TRIAD|nr:hypothetical protein TRIADDRAFT_51824 [Trichoplax adhaerens]EDV29462.1 hypothetical protein TRIADDRAFT_51824 [Trichoplax adhaerens]|eukprot:XP_002108664.1 hypothetical protein TRIADDRAFT_51824 [Trichoplax adhaerens]